MRKRSVVTFAVALALGAFVSPSRADEIIFNSGNKHNRRTRSATEP